VATDLKRTRFDAIRESELDMRCMVRDMSKRRHVREDLEKLQRSKRRGHKIDEVSLARLTAQSKRYGKDILERWGRLHRRMNRETTRRAKVESLFSERSIASGDTAHS